MLWRRLLCILCALWLMQGSVVAQKTVNKADLEKRRLAILDEIKEAQRQLELTKKDKNATMGQLKALQSKLNARQSLINNINQEINELESDIKTSSSEIQRLSTKLEDLKLKYAQSARYGYAHRNSSNVLVFLFSSDNFNDAVRRLKYVRKLRDYRAGQVEQIRNTQLVYEKKIYELNAAKTQKSILITTEEKQKSIIEQEAEEQKKVVDNLKGKEKELSETIAKNKKSAKQLENTISKIIQREIELARQKALEEERKKQAEIARQKAIEDEKKRQAAAAANTKPATGKDVTVGNSNVKLNTGSSSKPEIVGSTKPEMGPKPEPVTSEPTTSKPTTTAASTENTNEIAKTKVSNMTYQMMLAPEAKTISANFESNQGRLPWPVEKGIVTGKFGTHKHAIAEKVLVNNDGIDIQTMPNATVRAVFDGVVKSVFAVPGRGKVVLISHGLYFTVYSQLANVTVAKDEKVSTKQSIGTVGVNEDGLSVLNFQVWKVSGSNGSAKVNPELWIAK